MLHVGFGTADITPDPGMEMPGGFRRVVGKGVADRLLASTCVVHDGTRTVALVGVDSLFVDKAHITEARARIAKAGGIEAAAILVGANHTHTGGPTADCLGSSEDVKYAERLITGITASVRQALGSLHAAMVGVGTGTEATISFNRRFLMRDGREITHPGKPGTKRHADIVAVAGPIDPDVGVLGFRGADGKPVGAVVNFACHSTVHGGPDFHPDYAGFLRKELKARYGPGFGVVFLLGCCGDITQVDNMSPGREGGPDYCAMMGGKLARETERVLARVEWLKDATVGHSTGTVPVSVRGEPDVARERPEFGLGSGPVVEPVYEEERKHVAALRAKTPVIPAEVQAVRVGPLGIAAVGAEYFCEFGLRIKKCSPFRSTWAVSLANENLGYVPTATAFAAGGYEPRTARSSKLAVEAGQRLQEGLVAELHKLAPEPAPAPAVPVPAPGR